MAEEIYLKSIVDDLINQVVQILDLQTIMPAVQATIGKFYRDGMETEELNFGMNFQEDKRKVTFLQNYTFDNIKGMNADIAENLRKKLSMALMNQASISEMQKDISLVMDSAKDRAIMIARTETIRAENIGRDDAAQQSGLKLKKWLLVTEDHRTSGICQALHNKYGSPEKAIAMDADFVVNVGKTQTRAQLPPFHPNCRTSVQYEQQD